MVPVGVLGTGVPRLAFLWPAAWLSSGPVRPVFINPSSRPSRGAKPRGADDTRPPQGRPHQAGSRGGREIKARGTSRGACDVWRGVEPQDGEDRLRRCRRSGNGGPQTCLPAACGVAQVGGPVRPSFISSSSRPSRGAKPRGRTTGSFIRGSHIRQAREEAERSRQGYLVRSP